MEMDKRAKQIEDEAKKRHPRKGYTRDAFITGARWADVTNWHVTKDERPEEGTVVFCTYNLWREGTNICKAMNIATYKDGKFHSFSDEEPVLWMYPPILPDYGYEILDKRPDNLKEA